MLMHNPEHISLAREDFAELSRHIGIHVPCGKLLDAKLELFAALLETGEHSDGGVL